MDMLKTVCQNFQSNGLSVELSGITGQIHLFGPSVRIFSRTTSFSVISECENLMSISMYRVVYDLVYDFSKQSKKVC